MARVPMVVGYRLNPLTEKLLDRVVKVRQVNLVNLLLGEPLVPELLGTELHAGACRGSRSSSSSATNGFAAAHRQGYDEAMRRLDVGGMAPSLRAADRILEIIAARHAPTEEFSDDDRRHRQVPLSAHDDPGARPRRVAEFLHRSCSA